jgi:type VI secretion system protein ImpK
MTLLELTEPLFQYICCLNRSAKHATHDFAQVRREVEDLFRGMRSRAEKEASIVTQYEQVEKPLTLFVDSIIATGPFSFAQEWDEKRMAYELDPPDLAGDQTFFELLDETLKDRSEQASERLSIYYTCIGLGMQGMYMGQPELLRRKMQECASRLRKMIESNATQICPAAYQNIDDRDIIPKDQASLWAVGIALVVMVVGLFVANIVAFRESSSGLKDALNKVISSGPVHQQEQSK